ncbi:Mannose-P-dolichol utilization defect 1 protein-like protein [Aphelenchoides bicaudatus]|nr:Mannose-P-dolichol utilization defect 1 protein-like protein [Aphelenchoides bicaudatus]
MTSILSSAFNWAVSQVFPGNCWNRMVVEADVMDKKCFPIVMSRLLGFAITFGSAFLFVPQILKIHNAKSGRGISLISQLLALLSAGVVCAYSYEKKFVFSQWGDSLAVFIQITMIVMQILYFDPKLTSYTFAFMAFIWMLSMSVTYHYIPFHIIQALQTGVIPLIVVSKGIQIVTNFQNKSTGQLALVSVCLQLGGTVARVFTSIQETGDNLVIASFAVAAVLNGIIFLQMLIYWNSDAKKTAKAKKRN